MRRSFNYINIESTLFVESHSEVSCSTNWDKVPDEQGQVESWDLADYVVFDALRRRITSLLLFSTTEVHVMLRNTLDIEDFEPRTRKDSDFFQSISVLPTDFSVAVHYE